MIRTLLFISLMGLSMACTETPENLTTDREEPEDLIPEADMVLLMYDLELLGAASKQEYQSHLAERRIHLRSTEEIYAKHNVTQEQFERSFDYYAYDPQTMMAMYDAIVAFIDREIPDPASALETPPN